MKKRFLFSLLLLSATSLVGCMTAPLGLGTSARSLGEGNTRIDTQLNFYSEPTRQQPTIFPNVQLAYGVGENLDFRLRTEFTTVTLLPKYSFINSETGLSWAGEVGLAFVGGRTSYLAGTILSYKAGVFEPYLGLRYNVVNFDSTQIDSDYFENPPDLRFSFFSAIPGFNYWLTPVTAVGSEVVFIPPSSTIEFRHSQMYSLHFSFLF